MASIGGTSGNDTLNGASGDDSYYGGAGDDTITGGDGYDSLYGGDGNDVLTGNDDTYDDFFGGAGNDTIFAGDADDNSIYGGDGNDTVFGGAGDESMDGGAGNDMFYGGEGNDDISGGDGDDLIQGQWGDDSLEGGDGKDTFQFSNVADDDTIDGGSGGTDQDRIAFVAGDDVTVDFSGDEAGSYSQNGGATQGTFTEIEEIQTAGGDDTINMSSGSAAQTVYSGAGNDTIDGGSGADRIEGGDGNDVIDGGAGNDTLDGGAGSDTFVFGDGTGLDWIDDFDLADDDANGFTNDQLDVSSLTSDGGTTPVTTDDVVISDTVGDGSGPAILTFPGGESIKLNGITPDQISDPAVLNAMGIPLGTKDYTVDGTAGDDVMNSGFVDVDGDRTDNNDALDGSNNDVMIGGAGDDSIWGNLGNDTVDGGTGNDTLYGGDGDDLLTGGDGTDTMAGNAGNDTLKGGSGNDRLDGGDGDDSLSGGADDDVLLGRVGDDTLSGNDGNDTLTGNEGADLLQGGDGNDSLGGGADNDTLEGGDGNDTLYGNEGDDSISGGPGDDLIGGGAGNDTLEGGADNDTILGEDGDDLISGGAGSDEIVGGTGNDTLEGGLGNDTLYGNEGDDSVSGGDGDDLIGGNDGIDTLDGGSGNDTLQGGDGVDTLTGGDGNDTFDFVRGGDDDVVTDFSLTDTDSDGKYDDQLDVSDLRDLEGNAVNAWDVVVTDDGSGNALLTFPEGESIVLQGVTPAQMATAGQKFAAGIPCFTTGTLIRTPGGEVPVEMLRPGDMVQTRDNGPQPVVWSAMRHLSSEDLANAPELRPVVFAPGALGQDRRLLVSPQHGMLLHGAGGDQSLARAIHLARLPGGKIRVAKGVRKVTYVHLMFESHQVVWSNDLMSESFYPGAWGLQTLDTAALREMAQLFPDVARLGALDGYGETARAFLKFRALSDSFDTFRHVGGQRSKRSLVAPPMANRLH